MFFCSFFFLLFLFLLLAAKFEMSSHREKERKTGWIRGPHDLLIHTYKSYMKKFVNLLNDAHSVEASFLGEGRNADCANGLLPLSTISSTKLGVR